MASSRQERLEKAHLRSYSCLSKARELAAKEFGYDSAQTRERMRQLLVERFGQEPYNWQTDVAEAILLGIDSVVIAGTGAGKTTPFILPLLLQPHKIEIIASPLKILQKDQVLPTPCFSNQEADVWDTTGLAL